MTQVNHTSDPLIEQFDQVKSRVAKVLELAKSLGG